MKINRFKKYKLPKDFSATYEREIEGKAENKAKFFVSIAFITVIVFVLLGIRPLSSTTAQNRKLEKELSSIKIGLEKKINKIITSTEQINSVGNKIDLLNMKITPEIMLEEFLEEFVLSSAKTGFVVHRFSTQGETVSNIIPLDIELEGNLEALPKLIEIIEGLNRYAEIIDVRTGLEDGFTSVRINLRVYKL